LDGRKDLLVQIEDNYNYLIKPEQTLRSDDAASIIGLCLKMVL
jgi:hypothetical protein